MNPIADRMSCIDASVIRKIWEMAATMKDPVDFSIGAPDFGPPEAIKQSAIEAIQQGRNGYTLTTGIPELRQAIQQKVANEFGWQDPAMLVTGGLSGALLLAFMAMINPGDEVVVPDPFFVSYRHLVRMLGGKCSFVDTYPDFQLTAERLESAISDKTRLIVLNTPGNPTGRVYSEAELTAVAEVAGRHDLVVLADEIYWEFSYDHPATSIASLYEKTIVMRALSKSYGVPGWRVGYTVAHSSLSDIIQAMTSVQQYTFVCAPHPFQVAAVKAFDTDMSEQIAKYHRKRDILFDILKTEFELARPEGAFYAFVRAPGGDGERFVEEAIRHDVLIIPGTVFSESNTHVRISYATSDEKIRKGAERLCELARQWK